MPIWSFKQIELHGDKILFDTIQYYIIEYTTESDCNSMVANHSSKMGKFKLVCVSQIQVTGYTFLAYLLNQVFN